MLPKPKGCALWCWLIGLIVIAALPITLFAAVVAERLAQAERQATIRQVHERTEALAYAVERELRAAFATLTALAESTEAQRDDFAGLYVHAQRLVQRQSIGTAISLVDRNGNILFLTRRPFGERLPGVGAGDMSGEVFASGTPQISDLLSGTVVHEPLAIVHVPVMRGGAVAYDLRLSIRPVSLAAVLAEQKLPAEWNAAIVDRKGRFVARLRTPELVGEMAQPAFTAALAETDSGVLDLTKDGVDSTAVFRKVPPSGWTVAVSVPIAVLRAPSRRIAIIVATGGVALLLFGSAAAVAVSRHLTRKMEQAVTAAKALGRGDPLPLVKTHVREFAQLAEAHREASALLSQRGERLRLALEAAGAAPWDYDVKADRLTWSPESYRLYGFDRETAPVTGADWLSLLAQADRQRIEEESQQFYTAGEGIVRIEFRIAHPMAGQRWIAGLGRAIYDADGSLARIIGLNIDITASKEVEQALEQAKREAEEANFSKSRFLASASHDLRQPVQSLMLFTSLLGQQLEGRAAAKVVGHIEKAGLALKTLLDGLLDISRLDAGVIVPEMGDVAVGPLLDGLAAEYLLRAEQKGLRLTAVHCSPRVHTDPALLERILRNLIENAIKYTSRGRILIACRRRATSVSIRVIDTGLGIPKDQLRSVFLEFHQLHNPERDRSKGLGLGLSIVQRLSQLLGHEIEVSSRPGKGSCFGIVVPLARTASDTTHRGMENNGISHGRLAAVIDDEDEVRAGLQLQLEAWGYEVVAGSDHGEILALLGGRRPDLVLADYCLRDGLTGIQALRRIERAVDGRLRGVLLTGDMVPERIAEARISGYELLYKPVNVPVLRALLAS